MLISRESFTRVGGFGAAYRYGTEDVDLGLKLLLSGSESAGVGRSVLIHRESSSQNRASRDFRRLNRVENRRLFLESWGPQVVREYRLARLRCDPFWTGGSGAHVAVTLTSLDVADGWGDWYSGHEIGDALEGLGWRVSYVERKGDHWYELPEDVDYVLSLMDSFDLGRVPAHVGRSRGFATGPSAGWSGPGSSSRRRSARLLAGLGRPDRRAHRPSHDPLPAGGQPGALPSSPGRTPIRRRLRVHRQPVGQGARHRAGSRAARGRARGDLRQGLGGRTVVRLLRTGELAYEELALLYPSVKLVLDDTQGPTLPYGAVNARVFDALAAGTLVITNCESGVRELFDGDFPVWNSRESLRSRLDELLADGQRRDSLAARYRDVVLARHTYAHRAARLRELLIEHERRLTFCLKIGAPNREAAPRWGDLHFAESIARRAAPAWPSHADPDARRVGG